MTHFSELQRAVSVHYSPIVLCASPGEGVAPVLGETIYSAWLLIAWCISLSWLLDCYQDSFLCQGQGAQRAASAYGWVTRVLSTVKQAQSLIF